MQRTVGNPLQYAVSFALRQPEFDLQRIDVIGITMGRVALPDQPALYGKLARIQGLGLTLLSVNTTDEEYGS
jgi:hypothetical protein